MASRKFVINYYFKLGQPDIAGKLWLKYYIYNTAGCCGCGHSDAMQDEDEDLLGGCS